MDKQTQIDNFPCGCIGETTTDEQGRKWMTIKVHPDCKFDNHLIGRVWTWRNGANLKYVAQAVPSC